MDNSKHESSHNRTVADVILDYFYTLGITTLFVVPGAQIDFLLSQAAKSNRFQIVVAAHEQGAGYMADGFSRISGKPGVVIAINGPGATNLTTAAVTARVDHSPVLFLTGDAPIVNQGYGGFQCSDQEESNSNAIFFDALKNSITITTPKTLSDAMQSMESLFIASSPEPLHINLPCDVAQQYFNNETKQRCVRFDDHVKGLTSPDWLSQIPSALGSKAAILVGEQVRELAEMKAIAEFSQNYSIPLASTLAAKQIQSLIPDELYLGVFGYAGGPRAFEVILDSDLEVFIIFGASLDERNTTAWHPDFFHNNRKILRFTNDAERNRNYLEHVLEIVERPSVVIQWLENYWDRKVEKHRLEFENRIAWNECIQAIPRIPKIDWKNPSDMQIGMSMAVVVSKLNELLPADTILFLDSGDHRIYGGTFWETKVWGSFFTAAKTAPMGWAIGAAVGASFAKEDKPLWVITGDGCMLMHGMELAVAAKHNRRVVFVVSNNGAYGRIAARMKNESDKIRYTLSSLPAVSWSDLAQSLGVDSRKVTVTKELTAAIAEAQAGTGPFLIEVLTRIEEKCPYPPAVFSSSSTCFLEYWSKHKLNKSI